MVGGFYGVGTLPHQLQMGWCRDIDDRDQNVAPLRCRPAEGSHDFRRQWHAEQKGLPPPAASNCTARRPARDFTT